MEYGVQHVQDIIGSSTSPSTLTANYSGNQSSEWPIGGMHSIIVYCQYVPKTGQSNRVLYMQLELGPSSDDLYLVSRQSDVSGNTAELQRFLYVDKFVGATGGTTYKVRMATGDIADKWARFSFKEDGSDNFGTLYAKILYSGK